MLINDVAKRLNISPRAIRFYQEKGLITPTKSEQNQYRVFTEQDAWRLQTIVALREVGMSIEEIRKVLHEIDDGQTQTVQEYLELQRAVMFKQWIELKSMIETADRMVEMLHRHERLEADAMFQLADGSRRLREARENWSDLWNFDSRAVEYDQVVFAQRNEFHLHQGYPLALDTVYERIAPEIGEMGLDFGLGTGNLAGRFIDNGIRMAGVDQSRSMLNIAKQKYPQIDAKLGSFFAVPFFDDTFDFVASSFAFQHQTPEQNILALEEMHRVLKPHGRVCIADVMFVNAEHEKEHFDKLTREGKNEEISILKSIYVTHLSQLTQWFDEHGYLSKTQEIHPLLHVLFAVRLRSSR